MASEQWLLNDTSVANNAYFTAVTGGSYKLKNVYGSTLTRTTTSPTPYEGAGCYQSPATADLIFRFQDSSSNDITGGTYYIDTYAYAKSSPSGDGYFGFCGNNTLVQYSSVLMNSSAKLIIATYDAIFGYIEHTTTGASAVPRNEWFRVATKVTSGGVQETKLFKGTGIDGSTPNNTLTYASTYSSFEYLSTVGGTITNGGLYADNIKFDNTAYPTRSTAPTAAATATATATGTAAMSRSRTLQASATGTATGTAAASNQRALAASATGTASGTAAMSSTQAMSASGTGTATGTAAGSITAVVTIDGAGTGTASATAGASSTQLLAGSATVTATVTADGSIRPLVTVDGVGTITATGTTTFNKSQTLAATATATATASASMLSVISVAAAGTATASATAAALITTPGSLYGNATKVAGLYGSSTKPTLTTRS